MRVSYFICLGSSVFYYLEKTPPTSSIKACIQSLTKLASLKLAEGTLTPTTNNQQPSINYKTNKSMNMFKKPFFISFAITALACIPLYFLSTQEFSLTLSNFPIIALTLFIIVLVSSFCAQLNSARTGDDLYTDDQHSDRETGSVKWFNANKGFGFITRDSGDDVFVHFRSIRGEGHRVLHDGQRVEFEVSEGDKGLQADDVAVAG